MLFRSQEELLAIGEVERHVGVVLPFPAYDAFVEVLLGDESGLKLLFGRCDACQHSRDPAALRLGPSECSCLGSGLDQAAGIDLEFVLACILDLQHKRIRKLTLSIPKSVWRPASMASTSSWS